MVNLIAANEAVERKKPEPDVYLWALERLGLKAADCIAIEDSSVGLRAALASHLPTIVTMSDYTAKDDFTGASAVLSDLGERDQPARSLHGARPKDGLVDLAFLQTIRDSANAETASPVKTKKYLPSALQDTSNNALRCHGVQASASVCGQRTVQAFSGPWRRFGEPDGDRPTSRFPK